MKILWTDFALADLKSIHSYISKDSKNYADKFVAKIIDRVTQLESFPESGRIVPEFNSKIIREIIEGNYRIVYRMNTNHIGIVRIHHAARKL